MITDLMTVPQLATYLQVSRAYIYERTSARHPEHLPTIHLGTQALRFRINEIDDWLLERAK